MRENKLTVNIFFAPPNSGKTTWILNQIINTHAVIISQHENPETFLDQFSNFLNPMAFKNFAPSITSEEKLLSVIGEQKTNTVFFSKLSEWDENQIRYLDLFYSLCELSQSKNISIWGELAISHSQNLADIQQAAQKVMEMCPNATISVIDLHNGSGIHIAIPTHQYISAARRK